MTLSPPPRHPADRLLAAISSARAPVCVGLDPVVEKLPAELAPRDASPAACVGGIHAFTLAVLDAVASAGDVPCVKFQSACFERYGHRGVASLEELIAAAKSRGMEVILDAKRGDIGITASHYAAAAFGDIGNPALRAGAPGSESRATADWITINSYLGLDGIEPFLRSDTGGAFALARTSNPGGDALQQLRLEGGGTFAEAVARMIAAAGAKHVGERGYSALGAVVGATKSSEAARLRELMPQQIFLVPGYGAQGAGADDVLPCFQRPANESGPLTGAIVTASRSVIYAFRGDDADWRNAIARAARAFADEIGAATGWR
jgi:orotidine-5'-phosphate decarboxylase